MKTKLIVIALAVALLAAACGTSNDQADVVTQQSEVATQQTAGSATSSPTSSTTSSVPDSPASVPASSPASVPASTTTTSLPPPPECQEQGYIAVWQSESEEYECQQPPAPVDGCGGTHFWVEGEWECFAPCEETETLRAFEGQPFCDRYCPDEYFTKRIISNGRQLCDPVPECGQAVEMNLESSEPEEFFVAAFEILDIEQEERNARWIGGLGRSYNSYALDIRDRNTIFGSPWYQMERDLPEDYSPSGDDIVGVAIHMDTASFQTFLCKVEIDIADPTHICYDHDCDTEGNLIGSTSSEFSQCRVYMWHTEEGLYFLMRIDETSQLCVEAYDRAVSGEFNGASHGHPYGLETYEGEVSIDGAQEIILYSYGSEVAEITLTGYSPLNYPLISWPKDRNTWVAAIDFRQ